MITHQSNKSNSSGNKRAYKYSFWLGIIIATLFASLLFIFGKDKANESQIYSIATSLIAASIFAVIFVFLANKEFEQLIREEIREIKIELLNEIESVVKQEYNQYNPSRIYKATSKVDIDFNSDLTTDLKKSALYIYQGVSAKYVAIRVAKVKHSLSILKVITLDPRDSRSINFRARDRAVDPKNRQKQVEELCEEIKKEIYFGIIALFECRQICPIEIYYEPGTAVFRQEIFDDALYLSYYHTDKSKDNSFPESFRYSKNTMPFRLYKLDILRRLEFLEDDAKKFTYKNNENDIYTYLIEMGIPDPQGFMVEYKRDFSSFSQNFIAESGICN